MKTGRKDAQPGGLLVHLSIYFEAWRGTSLLVQLPAQMGGISQSLCKDLLHGQFGFSFPHVFKVHWGVS